MLCLLGVAAQAPAFEWRSSKGGRVAPLSIPPPHPPGFSLVPEQSTGIRFTNHLADASVAENQIRLLGSGVALGDVDGDGLCDIYLCRLEGPNVLYRNAGNWRFEEISGAAGAGCDDQESTGAALADLDGDGDLDLLVTGIGVGTRCFFNDGKARFTENNSGLLRKYCATSMALADIDGNGTLDLYVANYRSTTIRSTGLQVLNVGGRRTLRPEDRDSYELTPEGMILEHAEPDVLYLNDGRGSFSAHPWTGGNFVDADGQPLAGGDKDWGLSVMFRDMNGDGAPDVYVCNDFWSPDAVWINNGSGRFHALPMLALRTSSTFSMGIDFADLNRDGFDDFFVADMRSREHTRRMTQRAMLAGTPGLTRIDERPQTERNTLFLNRGDGTYAEIAQLAGVDSSEWSWATAFVDVDLDGYEDLLITTGHGFDSQDADADERSSQVPVRRTGDRILQFPRLHVPNQAFRNRGDLTFEAAGEAWGFNAVGVSHGLALADLDNDGDLDVIVNNLNAGLSVYRNNSAAPRIRVRLKGKSPNTQGIGARIELEGRPVQQSQEMIAGGRYLSCDAAERVFAAWNATNRFTLTVKWRGGATSVISNVFAGHIYEIDENAAASATATPAAAETAPMFADVSASLSHLHRDEPFNDFDREPLLSRRLSHPGPGLAWADVDGDGRDDLLVGSGGGGQPAVLRNAGGDAFRPLNVLPLRPGAGDEQPALVAWEKAAGTVSILVGQGTYESGGKAAPAVLHYDIWAGGVDLKGMVPGGDSVTGALALGDTDGDGDLDLFVGGRVKAGRYPEPASSAIYHDVQGKWSHAQELKDLGLVNGAVFSDLDGDGRPELVVACEWGPLKVLRHVGGSFQEMDWGLGAHRGWWTGVTAGDFDGDGRMDLIAGNWGRNTPYQAHMPDGIRIYYGDFNGSGGVAGVEAFTEKGRIWPRRDLVTMAKALPWLRGQFTTHAAYAQASLEQILGDRLASARHLDVNWPDSTLFLNRGGRFEARRLPLEAQFAPVFGVCASDFDGDGHEDVFLAQNFFPTDGETSRYDAGRGLLLRGDGTGNFTVMPGQSSGVLIYGDQRGAAACDYDADGRVDLAVAQNSAGTKLFRNRTATPGLRVRLRGPAGNAQAIGAVLRVVRAGVKGPAREIRAGSGYWSQDSAVQVLRHGDELWVRWPGGRETLTKIPPALKEISIDSNGNIIRSR